MSRIAGIAVGLVLSLIALTGAAMFGGIIGFAAGAASGAAAGGLAGGFGPGIPERRISGTGPEKVVIIRIVGPIAREDASGFFSGATSSRRIATLLDRAAADSMVRAVILDMDTPGGSVVASDEIHRKIQAVRQKNRVVVTLMTETAASGGYYIAAGTNHIVADPTTVTGSIGVIVALPNIQELSRKIGIRTIVFKSGAFKDLGNPNRAITPQEAAIFQGLVNEAYDRFVGIVAGGRRLTRAKVLQLADGRIYTGQQAAKLGLVDTLGHFPEAVEVVKQRTGLKDPLLVEYGGEGFLRTLLGSVGQPFRAWVANPVAPFPDLARPFSIQYLMVP
jgi:protease-4